MVDRDRHRVQGSGVSFIQRDDGRAIEDQNYTHRVSRNTRNNGDRVQSRSDHRSYSERGVVGDRNYKSYVT